MFSFDSYANVPSHKFLAVCSVSCFMQFLRCRGKLYLSHYGRFVITDVDGGREVRFSAAFVCLFVIPHDISKTAAAIESPDFTQKCFAMSQTRVFWSKGQRSSHDAEQKQCRLGFLHSYKCRLFLVGYRANQTLYEQPHHD